MTNWSILTATDILRDISTILSETHMEPIPQVMLIPYDTWNWVHRQEVIRMLKTRKRNKKRPAFATAWGYK